MDAVRRGAVACLLLIFAAASPASAAGTADMVDQWLPRSDGAEWVYEWSNSDYSPQPKRERYTLQSRSGTLFRVAWQQLNPAQNEQPSQGTMDFRHADSGLLNVNYQSTQPPPQFPILCASAQDCGNSLAGPFYMLIWGTRSPVIAEPLLRGTRWNSTGGADNDVGSANRYVGRARISVPAFPDGVEAAVVDSDITQGGALGDPFGSGVRTVHWVRGVGPVKIVFRHAGGELSEATLISTTLKPLPLPAETNFLPMNRGDTATYRWRNSRHMKRWSRQRFTVSEVRNNTARIDGESLSGPIKMAASYTFSTRLSGVTHLAAAVKAATRVKFPSLGPRSKPADQRRRFFTPLDLMVFGFNPVVTIGPEKGDEWRSSRDSSDFRTFGVTGRTKIRGTRRIRVPDGRFRTVVVRSKLRQRGYRFGSGTRTMYFADGKGLIKLVFRHRDGSVSTVERVR